MMQVRLVYRRQQVCFSFMLAERYFSRRQSVDQKRAAKVQMPRIGVNVLKLTWFSIT